MSNLVVHAWWYTVRFASPMCFAAYFAGLNLNVTGLKRDQTSGEGCNFTDRSDTMRLSFAGRGIRLFHNL